MIKTPKPYQNNAVQKLISRSKELFQMNKESTTLVFQSPTGSGKTFMITKYIDRLINEFEEYDFSFLWISIGKGGLHEQSYRSVKNEFRGFPECYLLEDEFFGGRNSISKNEIVFVDWEKLRNKDSKTGEWKNLLMKDKETNNFIDVLENTRNFGRKIVLIIDESHSNSSSERAMELRDEIVIPFLTIEMSATPVLIDGQYDDKVRVEPTDVINEGMIKKEVIINDSISEIDDDQLNSQELILEAAFNKRIKLLELYKMAGEQVNPLVLIQIPNADHGNDVLQFVQSFLYQKGITEENGKLAIWLTESKVNLEHLNLTKNNGKAEFLIFKQAIDTGWDCPRAQILVRFREIKSIVFEVQTLGRILRMPKGYHYIHDELNKAFVYTNIKSITVKKEVYNPNIIKSLYSKRKESYENIKLKSIYRNRVDFGDITQSFYKHYLEVFSTYFDIDQEGILSYNENIDKLKEKGITFENLDKLDELIINAIVDASEIDKSENIDTNNFLASKYSNTDLQRAMETLIEENLNGFAPKRSIPTVKESIYLAFRNYLDLNPLRNNNVVKIQSIYIRNKEIFSMILDMATLSYKKIHENEIRAKSTIKINNDWMIPEGKNFNPNSVLEYKSDLSIFEPFYIIKGLNGKPNSLEISFMELLELRKDEIMWFWQNGQEHMESNFAIEIDDKQSFQPDFIVKYKNGKIGIYDTKAIGRDEDDNMVKSNALQKYIEEEKFKGINLEGGIVVLSGSHFRIYKKKNYGPFLDSEENWEYF